MVLKGAEVETARGRARWWSPATAVFCTEVRGHFSIEFVRLLIDGFDQVVAHSDGRKVRSFQDLHQVTGYDSDARVAYTEGSERVMDNVEQVEFLIASRLLAMSIEVANIVLRGKLRGTTDRVVFEGRRAETIAARLTSADVSPG